MSSRSADRKIPYWLSYSLTAGALLVVTAALVLIVLPSRFMLVADLRESGVSFPTSADAVAFPMPDPGALVRPVPGPPVPVAPTPTDAELLWADLDRLLADGLYPAAIARMNVYLDEHPADLSVRRQRARTRALAGDLDGAAREFEDLVARANAPADRLALARLLRDLGREEEAERLYGGLLAERPDDLDLRHEFARFHMWSGQYPEAEALLADLVARAPGNPAYRLDLARVLYWSDRPAEARVMLAGIPDDAELADEARAFDAQLAELLRPPPEAEPEPASTLERARRAAAEEDLDRAAELYSLAAAEDPGDAALARERIDFVQYRQRDFEATITLIEDYRARFGADPDLEYRLAELYVWSEREREALLVLEDLVRRHPDRAEAWALLGDVRRYGDDRAGARLAYERTLALDPGNERATAGISELDRLRAATVASRERIGVGPTVSLFSDSDDFLQLDLAASGGWVLPVVILDATAGYRRIEGLDLAGSPTTDEGFFTELEAARWWSEASLRTAVSVGLDDLRTAGTRPVFGLSIESFADDGGTISLAYRHGPAYQQTFTLESALAEVVADQVQVVVIRPLGEDWALSGSADLLLLSDVGPTNTRAGGGLTLSRRLGSGLLLELGSRLLGFSDPAPILGRRLYWDPNLFWSNTVGLSVARFPEQGWGYRARLVGGAALSDERNVPDAEWIPQFGADAGIRWMSERTQLDIGAFYRRSREDEYSAYGLDLTLRLRP